MATDMETWNELLREAREATRLSRKALAELAGVSADTIFSYERGRRYPRRDTVLRLTRTMKLDAAKTNAILEAAGLEPEPSEWVVKAVIAHRPLAELPGELASYDWPCFATNERFEIVAWNEPAICVSEIDFPRELPELPQRNLLRLAATRHIRERLLNYDEAVGRILGLLKFHHRDLAALGEALPQFQTVVADIVERDGDSLPRLLQLWDSAPTAVADPSRIIYPVTWRHGDGTLLRFHCTVTPWSEFDGVGMHDWHPADAATWIWLGEH
jgi:transcriptional regulator with XRE-family HTH domain